MADDDLPINTYHPADDYSGEARGPVEWADWYKQIMMGAKGVGSQLDYGIADLGSRFGSDSMQLLAGSAGRQNSEDEQAYFQSMSPAGQEAATTWKHPASAVPMRILGMLPAAAATLIPGGFIGDAAGLAAMGGIGALQGAGEYSKALHDWAYRADDDQKRTSKFYDDLRNMGLDEDQATDMYASHMAK